MVALAAVLTSTAFADGEEGRIQRLEEEVEALRAALAGLEAEQELSQRIEELARRIDVVAGELESMQLGDVAPTADRSEHGLGSAASKVYRTEQGLSIGGYGEMLFESFDSRRDDGTESGRRDRIDLLRGILYVGYKFNDRWLFNSEMEVEHAATGEAGDVALEFAYVDYLRRPEMNLRAGLLLVPLGFLNELHEPPLFLGARRPDVERNLIPTTWRENGVGIFGEAGPWTYRAYLLNGLDASGFSAAGLRGGRQKGSQATIEDVALAVRLDYSRPGLLAGLATYTGDSGQGLRDAAGRIASRTTLVEAHLDWRWRGFELRALAVRASVDDAARLNEALGLVGGESVGEELEGAYLQVGYDLFAAHSRRSSLIPYARWESFDTQREVPPGFSRDPARDVELWTLGIAFRPLDQLILKADHQSFDNAAGTGVDQLNVAIGYLF